MCGVKLHKVKINDEESLSALEPRYILRTRNKYFRKVGKMQNIKISWVATFTAWGVEIMENGRCAFSLSFIYDSTG